MLNVRHCRPEIETTTPKSAGKPIVIDDATRRLLGSKREPRWSRFLEAWDSLAPDAGRLPARTDVDPARLGPDLLPNIFLVDVERAERRLRYRFRLLGQAIIERETTRPGDYLDQLAAAADVEAIERHYNACLEGKVSVREASLVWNDIRKDAFTYSVLMLPLADDGKTVSHLLGLALYRF